VAIGDRVIARGVVGDDVVAARLLLVVAAADIAKAREREQAEWAQRSVSGTVTALNPQTKEVTLRLRASGTAMVLAAGGEHVSFRRFTPGAVSFSDTKESKFEELKVGDQLRALGERSADGARLTAEKVISGAFQIVGGNVTSVNADKGEFVLSDIQTKKPVTVVVKPDSVMRRLTPELLKALQAGGQNGADASEVQKKIEGLPALRLAELKVGEGVLVLSAKGGDAGAATAIMLASGVEEYLKSQAKQAAKPGFTLDIALPGLP
jgi:Cu/Ag efflux protein CusF